MLPDHARLRELFLAACDLPESQQSVIVEEHCADDPELRRELVLLLRKDARTNGILADDKITDGIQFQFDTVVESELPKHIGRYRVKRVLGEGGMGVVYLAEQQNPARDVAVKVIRAGIVSPDLLKRFELEAAVLGRLTHPGIANIHEAGVFVDGATGQERPFLAMEHIDGKPLSEFVQRSNPATRDRLHLFVQICDAVHHAHQRGVIHRDLKPGNVLIKDNGQPSILDFGVARATGLDPGMSTLQTRAGQLIGTLPYMSPEQVTGNALDVDTRSDVYSLGVIAYELLAGKLPYDVEDVDYLRAAKAISEDLPTPLTSRSREFRGDLNTIVLKALEKDPERRYQSAKELGDDIQRYLDDKPIVALPIGPFGRAWKWCQRNKAVAALLSMLGLAIVLGFAGVTRQTLNALSSKRLAEDSAQRTERVLELLVRSFRSPDESIEGREVKMVDVLIRAASDLEDELTEDPLLKARLLHAIGESLQSLGVYDEGIRVYKPALAIRLRELGEEHPDTMSSMAKLALLHYLAGEYDEAMPLLIQSTALRTKILGEDHPDTLRSMIDLGLGFVVQENWDEAITLHEQTVQILRRPSGPTHLDTIKAMMNLGRCYSRKGDHKMAVPTAEEARRLAKSHLGERHPVAMQALNILAFVYDACRPVPDTIPLHDEAYAGLRDVWGEDHPKALGALMLSANAYLRNDNEAEAIRLLEPAVPTLRTKLGTDHGITRVGMDVLGQAYLFSDRPNEALSLREELKELQPTGYNGRFLAEAFLRTGHKEEGVEILQVALQTYRNTLSDDPVGWADALAQIAQAYLRAGMFAEAELHLRESHNLLRSDAKTDGWLQFMVQSALGASLAEQGNYEEAEPLLLGGGRGLLAERSEPPFPDPREIADAVRRIIRFYELTEQPDQAGKWRLIAETKFDFR